MRLFRVGALEYELRELRGERVISLHIPSDADLSSKAVDSSLNRAKTLLSGPFGGWGRVTCNSWLLSPALTPLLSESSNIRAFQRRFEITEWDGNAADFMGWLFEVPGALIERRENRFRQGLDEGRRKLCQHMRS